VFKEVKFPSKGELTCISRSIPLTELPSRLRIEYPDGYLACVPAIRYEDKSQKYLKGNATLEVSDEVLLTALDEGQTNLLDDPVWVRGGRYQLVDDLSNAEIIEISEIIGDSPSQDSQSASSVKIEFALLPMWKMDDIIIEKSLVQVGMHPP
jgi:hypothetical protein